MSGGEGAFDSGWGMIEKGGVEVRRGQGRMVGLGGGGFEMKMAKSTSRLILFLPALARHTQPQFRATIM